MLSQLVPPYDATVVEKLHHAGMVSLGKTNMDEFAMGSSSETSFYGAVKNPWDPTCVAGGSSGGAAAAVAARLVPAATGTDTGGSIRQPAAFCGISGLKPTYGRISRFGMIAFASSLDQAGPMAQTAEDLALLLEHMAGFDERDSTSSARDVPHYSGFIQNSLKGRKIGLPRQFFNEGLSSELETALSNVMEVYRKCGAEFVSIDLPHLDYAVPAYYVIAPAECSSNLSRFDGVRFGHRCQAPKNLQDLYERSRAEGFGDEVKTRILIGTYALSAGFYDAYYKKALAVRELIRGDFYRAFSAVDFILGPVTPTPAFKIGEKLGNAVDMYLSDIYTIAVNLAGLPALSFPIGFSQGLPVGGQLIGNYFDEAGLLNAVHQFQLETYWHEMMPERFI
jgi:aspartyl-tRNA(Asn)/glutamyl-tRNA(Gln) amidotransferase subunit A